MVSSSSGASAPALSVFTQVKRAIQPIIGPAKLTLKSAGTKYPELREELDQKTGFWKHPNEISSKPPRWLVQIDQGMDMLVAQAATDENGQVYSSASTVGYINNSDGDCAVCVFRTIAAVKSAGSSEYTFPAWEWLLVLVFPTPLPAGTSSDALTNFDPQAMTIEYGGTGTKQTYPFAMAALITVPIETNSSELGSCTYRDATDALACLVLPNSTQNVYDGSSLDSLQDLASAVSSVLSASQSASVPVSITPEVALVGVGASVYKQIEAALASGKRHLILYGPPGTGKTTIAQSIARQLSQDPNAIDSFEMLTASSSWSSQDLIGGYQPIGPGEMAFVPGVMLRHFDKPLVIDELNRCPIDKVIGPLFSVLSGQATTLPYRVAVKDRDSDFYVILPDFKSDAKDYEYCPGPYWRLIGTLNTVDKSQLGQISYALSRRFGWIKVGVPDNLEQFVSHFVTALQIQPVIPNKADDAVNPVAVMWQAVNDVREIGGAPIIDFIKAASMMEPALDFFALPTAATSQDALIDAFCMFILPLLDGISRLDADDLAEAISEAWKLDPSKAKSLRGHLADITL